MTPEIYKGEVSRPFKHKLWKSFLPCVKSRMYIYSDIMTTVPKKNAN